MMFFWPYRRGLAHRTATRIRSFHGAPTSGKAFSSPGWFTKWQKALSSNVSRRSSRGWPAALFPTDAAQPGWLSLSPRDYYLVFLGFAPVNNVGVGLGAVRKINARRGPSGSWSFAGWLVMALLCCCRCCAILCNRLRQQNSLDETWWLKLPSGFC